MNEASNVVCLGRVLHHMLGLFDEHQAVIAVRLRMLVLCWHRCAPTLCHDMTDTQRDHRRHTCAAPLMFSPYAMV